MVENQQGAKYSGYQSGYQKLKFKFEIRFLEVLT